MPRRLRPGSLPWCFLLGAVLSTGLGPVLAPWGIAAGTLLALCAPGIWRLAVTVLVAGMIGPAVVLADAVAARPPAGVTLDALIEGRIVETRGEPPRSLVVDLESFSLVSLLGRCAFEGTPRRVRLSLFDPLPVQPDARWRFMVRLRAPHGFANPGGGDTELASWRQGIDAVGYVKSAASARELDAAPVRVRSLRSALGGRIDQHSEGRGRRLLRALLLGEQDALSADDRRLLAATGTIHLLVVSGLHVSLVAACALFVARALGCPPTRWIGAGMGFCAAFAYAWLTGFGVPAQRALVMLSVGLVALLRGRRGRPFTALAWAGVVLVLLDPRVLLSAGTWLSFVAVAGLLRLVGPGEARAPRPLRALLLASAPQLIVALVLAGPLLGAFGAVPLLAPLINLVAVPLVAFLALPLGLLSLLLCALGVAAAGIALEGVAGLLAAGLEGAASVPQLLWAARVPHGLALVIAMGCALAAVAPLPRLLRCALLSLWLGLVGVPRSAPAPGHVEVHVLDVGQGLAVIVRTARRTLLYDAGPRFGDTLDAGMHVVLPALRALGVTQLDRILISHGDSDHAGGLASVRLAHPEADLYAPVGTSRARPCAAPERWIWDGVTFSILHPRDPTGAGVDNGSSCVLAIEAAGLGVLLPGDIDVRVERRLAAALGQQALVVAPHHGSRTSSGRALVRETAPRWVVFAAGEPSPFGHPHPEVVQRWIDGGAGALVTGRVGAVRWTSREPERIERARDLRRRWWNSSLEQWAQCAASP
ncbi:MAG: DNA internalization-related competence protein ComEC/Rec2 [Pseudomonadales bacterium]|nr:DNA internalization-related competence protein ComEC/Rec2 [Pseudomonadales bacterium]